MQAWFPTGEPVCGHGSCVPDMAFHWHFWVGAGPTPRRTVFYRIKKGRELIYSVPMITSHTNLHRKVWRLVDIKQGIKGHITSKWQNQDCNRSVQIQEVLNGRRYSKVSEVLGLRAESRNSSWSSHMIHPLLLGRTLMQWALDATLSTDAPFVAER